MNEIRETENAPNVLPVRRRPKIERQVLMLLRGCEEEFGQINGDLAGTQSKASERPQVLSAYFTDLRKVAAREGMHIQHPGAPDRMELYGVRLDRKE